jgi:hypothetical protein
MMIFASARYVSVCAAICIGICLVGGCRPQAPDQLNPKPIVVQKGGSAATRRTEGRWATPPTLEELLASGYRDDFDWRYIFHEGKVIFHKGEVNRLDPTASIRTFVRRDDHLRELDQRLRASGDAERTRVLSIDTLEQRVDLGPIMWSHTVLIWSTDGAHDVISNLVDHDSMTCPATAQARMTVLANGAFDSPPTVGEIGMRAERIRRVDYLVSSYFNGIGWRSEVFKAPRLLEGDLAFLKMHTPRFARLAEIMAMVVEAGLSTELPEANCPQLFFFLTK